MASKRSAISDLIKSDMSRRSLGDEEAVNQGSLWEKGEARPEAKPPKKSGAAPRESEPKAAPQVERKLPPAPKPPAEKPAGPGAAALIDFISAQAGAMGLTGEADRQKLYDFLQGQAERYLRGFNAARRFYGG
jgi:hypothetical protein